jgi:hypothetical protein
MNSISNQLMRAALARLEAERQEALAIIELYLNASVGVGDHPDVITVIITATHKLAAAEESMETLQRNFINPSTGIVEDE